MKNKKNKMDRKDFIRVSAAGAVAASLINPLTLVASPEPKEDDLRKVSKNIRKDFFTYACSGALFMAMNRHYGYPKENEAPAVASLSGGLMQKGYQCGMLWGASLAAGAESYRRFTDPDQATGKAIEACRHLIGSFSQRAKCIQCRDITGVEWTEKRVIAKYMLKGKLLKCFFIARKWPPEAIQAAENAWSDKKAFKNKPLSCASEVAKKLGADEEKRTMVAGFAGGIGLSGDACGALGAAVLLKSLNWPDINSENGNMYNPEAQKIVDAFLEATEGKMLCREICGKKFSTLDEHTEHVKNGGCAKLMEVLVKSRNANKGSGQ